METDYHNYSVVYSCTVVDILTPIKYFSLKENSLQSKAIGLIGYLQHFMVIVQDFLFGAIKLEFAWILAREKHLDPEMVRYYELSSNINRKKYFTLTLSLPPA